MAIIGNDLSSTHPVRGVVYLSGFGFSSRYLHQTSITRLCPLPAQNQLQLPAALAVALRAVSSSAFSIPFLIQLATVAVEALNQCHVWEE
jgi:hypothetical protein